MQPVIANEPPKYEYTPNNFMVLSLITVILCGIFSPLSLLLSLPALFFSQQASVLGRSVVMHVHVLLSFIIL